MIQYVLPRTRIRRSFLDAEYKKCGIPVIEITYRQWQKKISKYSTISYVRPSEYMGLYYNDKAYEAHGLPSRFILINKTMPNYEKLMVYWHEVGHHSCVKTGCLCSKRGFVFRKTELHAELAAIYISHKRGFRDLTLELLKETVMDLESQTFHYIRNATMMVKHPSFVEARESVQEEFDDWLDERKNERMKERYESAIVDSATRTCRWTPSPFLKRFVFEERPLVE